MARDDVSKYIEGFLMEKRVSFVDAARQLGVTPASVSALVHGKRQFSPAMAQKWQDTFGFSASWLIKGEGKPFVRDTAEEVQIKLLKDMLRQKENEFEALKEMYSRMREAFLELCEITGSVVPVKSIK